MSANQLASQHAGAKPALHTSPPKVKSLELYDDPHSEYSAKVKVALFAKGLAWSPLPLPCGTTRSAEFRAVNPLGKIPALRVTFEDGRSELLIESEVILEFLEDAFPDAPCLLPTDPLARSKARLVSRYHDLYLEPALRRLYPQVAPSVRDERLVQEAVAGFKERIAELAALLPPVAGTTIDGGSSSSSSSSSNAFALGQLQPGGGLGLADCAYPALLLYAELILPGLEPEGAGSGTTAGAGAGVGLGIEPGRSAQEAPLGAGVTGLEAGRGMGAVYSANPRLWAWRQALWGHPAVQAVFAELVPAAEEWVAMKLQQ